MPDQADKLRKLVVDAAPRVCAEAALPPTIVVTGGKGGVGTTTVAINLAAALVQHGRRTMLVDAAPHADAAQLLGIEVERGGCLDDVLSGAITAVDALCAGPAGISLLAGQWAAEQSPDRSHKSLDRLLQQLQSLDLHADALVIDSGRGATNWTHRLWQEAALVLLVTTPDDVAVMDTYTTIKRGIRADEGADLRVLVNACHDTATAIDVQRRVAAACRRFLGRSIGRAPLLPRHVGALDAGNAPLLAWETLASPFARSINQLGRFAADVIAHHQRVRRNAYELSRC
jgi:flagellar biosynthesis protein FlhG